MRRRYRQDPKTLKLVEISADAPSKRAPDTFVQGSFDPFVSPVDRTVITSHKALREHNERNGVMHRGEMGPNEGRDYWAQKAKERADHYNGTTHTLKGAAEQRRRKADIAEALRSLEQ